MRMILLSAVIALGAGLAGTNVASAAGVGSGIDSAAKDASVVEQIQYYYNHHRYCRNVRVCRYHHGYRRCYWTRVCR